MSKLYQPYRSLGLITGDASPAFQALGKEQFIYAPIGRAYHVYKADTLRLAFVSPLLSAEDEIHAIAAWKELVLVAAGAHLRLFRRQEELAAWACPDSQHGAAWTLLHAMGQYIACARSTGEVDIVDLADAARTGHIEPVSSGLPRLGGSVTALLHPATYLNKLVLASDTGCWCVYNFRTGKTLYSAQLAAATSSAAGTAAEAESSDDEDASVAITTVVQSPVVDVLAFGRADGWIQVHNVKLDAGVVAFRHGLSNAARQRVAHIGLATMSVQAASSAASITALAFSTDAQNGEPLLLSTTSAGSVALWDLNARALHHVDHDAHASAVSAAYFVPQQPVFITAGHDNALVQWQLDSHDRLPRLVRERRGHTAPPAHVQYYSGDGVATMADGSDAAVCEVLSAGRDRALWMFHTAREGQSRELSQGNLRRRAKELGVPAAALRLPPVTALAASDRRRGQSGYHDVVTAHEGSSVAHVWQYANKALGGVELPLPDQDDTVTAVCLSACGSFAVLGSAAGTVSRFNMQSGAARGEYPKREQFKRMATAGRKRRAPHSNVLPRADRDVGQGKGDVYNQHLSGSVAASIRAVMKEGAASAPASARAPTPHSGAIRGLAVDYLNKFLISACADGTARWWDLSSHALVQTVRLGSPATAVASAPRAGLLAIALDNGDVHVYDMAHARRVRRFLGAAPLVRAMAWSPDARWLVTAGADGSLRTWDLPTARCIDWVMLPAPVAGLAFSPTSEWLVTSHAGSRALHMWINRASIETVSIDGPASGPVPAELPHPEIQAALPQRAALPARAADDDSDSSGSSDDESLAPPSVHTSVLAGMASSAAEGIHFAGVPQARWANLGRLEEIAQRNKPVAPPKEPEAAPFFLPTVKGLQPAFAAPPAPEAAAGAEAAASKPSEADIEADMGNGVWNTNWSDSDDGSATPALPGDEQQQQAGTPAAASPADAAMQLDAAQARAAGSRLLQGGGARSVLNTLGQGLAKLGSAASIDADDERVQGVLEHLATASPALLDAEIRSLCWGAEDDAGCQLIARLLAVLAAWIASGQQFELVQGILSLVLQVHGDLVAEVPSLKDSTQRVVKTQVLAAAQLESRVRQAECLVKHLAGLQ